MGNFLLLLLALFSTCYCQNVPVIDMTLEIVREDLPVGAYAFTIKAYDIDNDPLTYRIENDKGHFEVVKDTGEVYIKKMLDREEEDVLLITVFVNDGVYSDTEKAVTIIVEDANDEAPIFENTPYNVAVLENIPVGSTVLTVLATDRDLREAGIVSYSISEVRPAEGTSLFSIDARGGQVVLNEMLSFTDKSAFYQIKILASDGGGQWNNISNYVQTTNVTAFLTVNDVADLDPQFLNLPSRTSVKENSPLTKFKKFKVTVNFRLQGTSVYKVQARDPDTGINDVIHYSIDDSDAADLFQIDEKEGLVSVKSPIDRELLLEIGAVVMLRVKATEANLDVNGVKANTTETLEITIEDVNDNKPLFYKCEGDECTETNSFSGDIDEHSSVGLAVAGLNMKVKDNDQNNNVQNSLFHLSLEGPDSEAFSISPTSGISEATVLIQIKNPDFVDFEKQTSMSLQVVAKDPLIEDFVSTATVTIQINDINDNPPEFEFEAYKLNVSEHCSDGTFVQTVTATDKDALDFGKLTYRLFPDSILTLFNVFPNNGTVYVVRGDDLDRERTSSYSPILQARDSAGNIGTTVLEITILDINDQIPQFVRQYEIFIRENEVLEDRVEARDNDEQGTPNSKIIYGIEDSDYSANFTIDPDTGEIKSNGILDREAIDIDKKGVIVLNLTATDMGTPPHSSTTTFVINVDDVNDNEPIYQHQNYIFSVKESHKGEFVGSILAHDADQTEFNNRISFSIINGGLGSFLCRPEQTSDGYLGNIQVDPDVALDYESDFKSYTLIIQASDLGQKKADVTVNVEVVDVNDTPPIFPAGVVMEVKENSPTLTELEFIKGSDVDTNATLIYELISLNCYCNRSWDICEEDWLILERDGMVKTSPDYNIDYEKCTEVEMKAKVVDLYTEIGRNYTEGVVTIKILDVNDNAPEFIPQQEFFVVISENVEQGTSVASVYAGDKDSGEHKKIIFDVVNVTFASSAAGQQPELADLFYADSIVEVDELGNYKGVIKSQRSLDRNIKGKYLVEVAALSGELRTHEIIQLITVDQSFKVSLRFNSPVVQVNQDLPVIRGALIGATKAMVHVVKVISETQRAQRNEVTLLEAYFVFSNGTALSSDDVGKILNSGGVYEEYGVILQQHGLTGILSSGITPSENKLDLFIMIGVVAALVIVLTVTVTSLVCLRKSYQRKLKAAKAMNTAAMMDNEDQKGGPVVPGTNKYTREGANPVLNLNIDTATDLGFDEDASSADRESLNSLDYNIDMTMNEKDTMPMMPIEEEDEDESPYIEPLGAALAQRGKRSISEGPSFTMANPSLSTTDL